MMDLEMPRQALPEPSDGELYLMKMPEFLAIEPTAWSHDKFQPPTTDLHSSKPPSTSFSAYKTALSTMRWRHSPSDPEKLQSNARILRWSDGSLTLQLASQPQTQYEIDGNPLAPPQRNPLKPTPVSIRTTSTKGGRQGDGTVLGEKYDASKDAFTYLVVPSEATSTLRVTHKITAGLSMKQPETAEDEAIERLQAALATAANATKVGGPGRVELELIDEDPDKKRQQAEIAVREKARMEKRKQAAQDREQDRNSRVLGRSGMGSSRYGGGGLSAGMLEDEDGMGTTRGRKTGATPRKSRQRRNSIYSDDEDFGRKMFRSKEDEYDEEDDFLAPSDEEEVVEDDEDPDDGIVEEAREPRRERTPKRDREPAGDDEADAEGEVDEEVQQVRGKRRRIVDEDEDDE
jgi:RNA polymerase-associated protein LEO1